jgi:predicted nicotinamide N-methyase
MSEGGDDIINEDDDDDDYENGLLESIRTETGLEIGCRIHWASSNKNTTVQLELSTVLPSTAIAPIFDGTQWAGTRLWRAAIVAIRYLELNRDHLLFHKSGEGKTILELGCGLGVPGMILHAQTGCPTVVTDKDDLLEQLENNIQSNFENKGANIYARSLDWTAGGGGVDALLQSLPMIDQFDVVLNCDCIYEPLYGQSWKALLACQEQLLRLNPDTVMITSCERRRADGVDLYLEAAKASPVIREVEKLCTNGLLDCTDEIELYRLYGGERRRIIA